MYPSTSPDGVLSKIKLTDNRNVTAELLEFSEDTLYFLYNSKIYKTHISDTRKIHLKELEAPARGAILVMSGIVSASIGVVTLTEGGTAQGESLTFGIGLTAVGILSMTSGIRGNPLLICRYPFDEEELNRLLSSCRYPQGLTNQQRQLLLKRYRQDEIIDALNNNIPILKN
ncbi:MAG: hypothetical protein HKO89_09055 [Saprospiraceae bacterium]|nr:hypothetical protein [Bacteroidia bacterium]NNK90741.1 hypothetical protein [Saprospiraceae bacterium]